MRLAVYFFYSFFKNSQNRRWPL